ncbi:MAG: peptidase [Methylobacter sp.]|nr:MAG: peptidase [Methylobacter sp.]
MTAFESAQTSREQPSEVGFWRLARLKARRKVWLKAHLWLGLALGLFLAVFGLTGSILVFQAEVNELLNPALLTVEAPSDGSPYQPLSELIEAGCRAMPAHATLTFANYPRNKQATLQLNFKLPVGEASTENWQVMVNPYTAKITGKQLLSSSESHFPKTFIGFIFELHYALLLGEELGYLIVGSMGAVLIISTLTGLIVWWPLTGKWRQALTVKRKASAERLTVDLHKTAGFYSAAVLLPVLFSGVYMNLPEQVVPVLELFSPVTYRYNFLSQPHPGLEPITMAEVVAIAKARYPKGHPHWIYGAPSATDTYTVCLDDVDRPGSLLQRVCIVLDRYTGKVIDLDDPAEAGPGEIFTHWQWPLHSGQAAGLPGRILVCLTGLACPLLFVTGVIRWCQKRRAYRLKQRSLGSLVR